jgi:hypothetical protein
MNAPTEPKTTTEPAARKQSTFTVVLRAEPGVNPVLALRAALKLALRKFGLRCVSAIEETDNARSNNQ